MTTTYLSVEQVTARLALRLPSSHPARAAWEAASADDKAVFARQAQQDLDACHWRGAVPAATQATAWPRVAITAHAVTVSPFGVVGVNAPYLLPDPAGDADALIASIPADLKTAFALQAAYRAMSAAGLTGGAEDAAESAHKGIVSASSQGESRSVDRGVAASPWAALWSEAARLVDHLRSRGGAMV